MVGRGAAWAHVDRLIAADVPDGAQPGGRERRTPRVMRLVLEWLGLMRPDPARKEPVVVPAWGPYVVAASVALLATATAALLHLVIGRLV